MQTYLLLQDGKEWHESKEPAVYHGVLRYQRYSEHLHACKIRGCRGGDEEGCSNLNGLNTTKSTVVRLGICTPISSKIWDFMRDYEMIHDFEKTPQSQLKSRLEAI